MGGTMEQRARQIGRGLFSFLLSAALVIAFAPIYAFADTTESTASISVSSTEINQGEALTISTSNLGATNNNMWVGLYAGDENTTLHQDSYDYEILTAGVGETSTVKSLGWYYPTDYASANVTLTAAGEFTGDVNGAYQPGGDAYPVNLKAGKYVIAVMQDGLGQDSDGNSIYKVVARAEFTVNAVTPSSQAEFTMDQTANDQISFTTSGVEQDGAWVGIYKRSDAVETGSMVTTDSLTGWMVNKDATTTAQVTNSGITVSTSTWGTTALGYGHFTAALFDEEGLVASEPYLATKAIDFTIDGNGTVKTDKTQYEVGDPVTVTATDPTASDDTWVGIYPEKWGVKAGSDLQDTSTFPTIPVSIAYWTLKKTSDGASVTIQDGSFTSSLADGVVDGTDYKVNDAEKLKLPRGNYTAAVFDCAASVYYVTDAYNFQVGEGDSDPALSIENSNLHVAKDGEQISAKVKVENANSLGSGSWVGLYGKDETPGPDTVEGTSSSIAYFYISEMSKLIDDEGYVDMTAIDEYGKPANSVSTSRNDNSETSELNLKPGNYKVILFGDSGYGNQLQQVNFTVTDHKYVFKKVNTPSTCTKQGSATYACSICGETKTERLSLAEHTWDKGVVTKAATATKDGEITYTCTVCKTTRVETIPATGAFANGDTAVAGKGSAKAKYKVISAKKRTVKYVKSLASKKVKKVTVPKTVKLSDGKTYKVTTIETKAFNNKKKLTKVTVGSNIKKICKSAFYKTPKLKTLVVKSKKLKFKKSVAKAFKGSKVKKLTVKAPKSVKKAYKKSFSKKNLRVSKKVTVK